MYSLSIHASTEDLARLRKLWRTYREYKRLQKDLRLKQQALKEQGSTRQNDTTSTTPTPNPAVNNKDRDLSKGEQKTKTPSDASNTPNTRRCWDWMMASGSAHYARNRSSFSARSRPSYSLYFPGHRSDASPGHRNREAEHDPQGQTYMEDETVYMLSIHATDEELKSLFRKAKHRGS
ncbi:hypothetical protein SI65_01519 [Aspergillus cristatus]|uniref:Uncharacterized protein n=1 Tax=Aspergillus cristatus TaxID=573508 RepID=A0A1E3BSJ5_ASPCR|nr:hypothetical protein SI65_01519 [Aspergillus cristatus]